MIPRYWCEFWGFWRPKHQTPCSWWRRVSLPITFEFVSKFKRRQCKLSCNAKWEPGRAVGHLCAFTSCHSFSIISIAKTSALKWQLQTNTKLCFPPRQQRVCYWDQYLWGKGHLPEYTRKFCLWVSTWLLTWSNGAELWRWVQHSAFNLAFSCFLHLLSAILSPKEGPMCRLKRGEGIQKFSNKAVFLSMGQKKMDILCDSKELDRYFLRRCSLECLSPKFSEPLSNPAWISEGFIKDRKSCICRVTC